MIRTVLFCVAFTFAAHANAECPNGKCAVRTVTKATANTVRNVAKGTVQVVKPRCPNGKCRVGTVIK